MKKLLLTILLIQSFSVFAAYNPKWIQIIGADKDLVDKENNEKFDLIVEFQDSSGAYSTIDWSVGEMIPIQADLNDANVATVVYNANGHSGNSGPSYTATIKNLDITDQESAVKNGSVTIGTTPIAYKDEILTLWDVKLSYAKDSTGSPDYQVLTEAQAQNVLPGERIKVSAQIRPGVLQNAFRVWNLPGQVFKDYVISTVNGIPQSKGEVIDVDIVDKFQQELTFYWADAGDNRKVEFNITLFGPRPNSPVQQKTFKLTFNVKQPISTKFTAAQGATKRYDFPVGHPAFGVSIAGLVEDLPNGVTQGMIYVGQVDIPQGFGFQPGNWGFVQCIQPNYHYVSALGQAKEYDVNSLWCLDDSFPYSGVYNTGTEQQTDDTPHIQLGAYGEFAIGFLSATTYQIFKPAGPNSKWVTLKSVDWDWSLEGQNANPNGMAWVIDPFNNATKNLGAIVNDTTQPEWTNNASAYKWVNE